MRLAIILVLLSLTGCVSTDKTVKYQKEIRESLENYLTLPGNKAFAVARDANRREAAGFAYGFANIEDAKQTALTQCQKQLQLAEMTATCQLIRINEKITDHLVLPVNEPQLVRSHADIENIELNVINNHHSHSLSAIILSTQFSYQIENFDVEKTYFVSIGYKNKAGGFGAKKPYKTVQLDKENGNISTHWKTPLHPDSNYNEQDLAHYEFPLLFKVTIHEKINDSESWVIGSTPYYQLSLLAAKHQVKLEQISPATEIITIDAALPEINQ